MARVTRRHAVHVIEYTFEDAAPGANTPHSSDLPQGLPAVAEGRSSTGGGPLGDNGPRGMTLGARGSGSAQGRTGPGAEWRRGPPHVHGTSRPAPSPATGDPPSRAAKSPSGHMPHAQASHANGLRAAIPRTESSIPRHPERGPRPSTTPPPETGVGRWHGHPPTHPEQRRPEAARNRHRRPNSAGTRRRRPESAGAARVGTSPGPAAIRTNR